MSKIVRLPDDLRIASDTFEVFDDFAQYTDAQLWTKVLTDSGTAAAAGVGGILTLTPSDGTVADDDEAYVGLTNSIFKPAAGKPIYLEGLVQFSEAATNAANVAFGLASVVAANLIVDDGVGLRTSGTVIAIYKVDGETVWRVVTRNGTNVTINQSTTTAGGTAYQKLAIEILDVMAGHMTVTFRVNDQILRDATTNKPIVHDLVLSGIVAAALFAGVKNGSANQQTLLVDYAGCVQSR